MPKAELFSCHQCKLHILVIHEPEYRKIIYIVRKRLKGKHYPCFKRIIVVDVIEICPECTSRRFQPVSNGKMLSRLAKEVNKKIRGGA